MKIIFKLAKWKEQIPGGKAEGKQPSDFDKEQLSKGTAVEAEHSPDKKVAKEIAMDHLEESEDKKDKEGGKYYDKLEEMEKEIEGETEAFFYFDLIKFAKKSKKKKKEYDPNPWAVCNSSVGGKEGEMERSKWDKSTKDKYERCVKKVKKQDKKSQSEEKIVKAESEWPEHLKKGRFTSYCKRNGFSGPSKECANKAMESSDASVRGMASFYLNTVKP